MDSKPLFDKSAAQAEEGQELPFVPISFVGIAARKIHKNPFNKKGRLPYVLKRGAMYLVSESSKEDFESYLKQFVQNMIDTYGKLPFDDAQRQMYKRSWNKFGNEYDGGMILHYWTQAYKGLQYVVLDLKESAMRLAMIYGKDAQVDLDELTKLSFGQMSVNTQMRKSFESFVKESLVTQEGKP